MDFDFSNIINAISEFFSGQPNIVDILTYPIGLIGSLTTIFTAIIAVGAWLVKRRSWQKDEMSKLTEISDDEKRKLIKSKIFVPTMGQYEPPHNGENAIISEDRFSLLDLILKELFSKSFDKKRYIVMGGSGMGKSTFLAAVFLKYIYKRRIRKSPYPIYVKSLGNPDVVEQIRKINNEKINRSILLLDALDENIDATNNLNAFMNELESVSNAFRIIIITCRTQFFKDAESEPVVWSIPISGASGNRRIQYNRIYISPFTDNEVSYYLKNKYSHSSKEYEKASLIATKSIDIMSRPMILSFMDDLLELNDIENIKTVQIYSAIINKWFDRETEVKDIKRSELLSFSKKLAIFMYDQWQASQELFLSPLQYRGFLKSSGFQQDPYSYNERSLVNRTSDGRIKFSHRSFWEFFLSIVTFEQPGKVFSNNGLTMAEVFQFELSELYFNDSYLDCIDYFNCNSLFEITGFNCIDITDKLDEIDAVISSNNQPISSNHRLKLLNFQLFELWEMLIKRVINEDLYHNRPAFVTHQSTDSKNNYQVKRRILYRNDRFTDIEILFSTFMKIFESTSKIILDNDFQYAFDKSTFDLIKDIIASFTKKIISNHRNQRLLLPLKLDNLYNSTISTDMCLHIGIGFKSYSQVIVTIGDLLTLEKKSILFVYIDDPSYYELIDLFEKTNLLESGSFVIFKVFYKGYILDFFAQNRRKGLTYKIDNESRIKKIIEIMYFAKTQQVVND